ncbi:MAG: T9SS type A sorting domain-containing protein [Candidatus Cloacimonetes bacterium]|nr:T9SS type A sorting domain-containing protein [Candidatus Cloacimonadota bacterium]
MKKLMVLMALMVTLMLCPEQITVANPDYQITELNGYTLISHGEDTIYEQEAGAPGIPLVSVFIDLAGAAEFTSLEVKAQGIKTIRINKPMFPVQQAEALSQAKNGFTEMKLEFYNEQYPKNWLKSYNTGICGSTSLAGITLNGLQYNALTGEVQIPQYFELTYETTGFAPVQFSDNYAVNQALTKLGLTSGDRDPSSYLLIAPLQFQNALQPLIDWRYQQGYDVYFRSIGEISTQYEGEDLAAQVRACIADMQLNQGIDFVTLAGDTGHIPARYAYAFDCAYGVHAGENDLACDMYYSCLDGNWNADADTLYGEDEDEVDLYPEVFVGRIPANSTADLMEYINKLVSYEKGLIDDYEVAGGLSMELWAGSASEQCQQYIYDNYFPDTYDIEFLYNDENTEENAFAMLSAGKNIVQHTGHAFLNVLSLPNYGHIYIADVENLTNDWGGMFYSIGCWSLAFDYDTVGEAFVRTPERNFLGYIGNSSYGWGAPSAPSFGFSEFYQREFFHTLFDGSGSMELGTAQALQKLPFTAFYQGASVFKWVGYELNLSGDAAALLNTLNPREMEVLATHVDDQLYVQVTCNGVPVTGAVISDLDERWLTGNDGFAFIPWQAGTEFYYSVYARNYRWQDLSNEDVVLMPLINFDYAPEFVELNTYQGIHISVINPLTESISFTMTAGSEPEVLTFDNDPEEIFTAAAGETISLPGFFMNYYNSNYLNNGTEITALIELHTAESGELLATGGLNMVLRSADIKLVNVNWEEDEFIAGDNLPITYNFRNDAELNNIEYVEIYWNHENDEYIDYSYHLTYIYPTNLSIGDEFELNNLLYLSSDLPEDYFTTSYISVTVHWGFNKVWYKTFPYCVGNANLQLDEDFEEFPDWEGDEAWQQVDTYSVSGSYSLSCRPAEIGHYLLTTPLISWSPGTELSFQYKFQMPMYGEDGFMLKFVSEAGEQNIVFLGSGGALSIDNGRPPPDIYIEADWAYYQFYLDEILSETPETGSSYQLVFDFYYAEIIEDFSEYATMPEIGIFIDDLTLEQTEFITGENDNLLSAGSMTIYPNPFYLNSSRQDIKILLDLTKAEEVKINLYDLKGRLCGNIASALYPAGTHEVSWNPEDLASGIYFVRMNQGEITKTGKILILR